MVASWWSPQTDAGVVAQVVVTIIVGAAATVAARREPSLQLLAVGITMVLLGWYGIRGLH
ncbi:MAG: hypothetical protein AAGG08_02755 [Actinomycetota bacterium]